MRTLIHTLFFFLLVTQICFSQWYQQNSGTTASLLSVTFVNSDTGWVVGGGGTILRTTNGGTIWTLQISGTAVPLLCVSFTDANNGTTVGSYGTILKTTNGGTTWALQSSGTTTWLYGVSFTDANNGTTVGDGGTILRTTDGGQSWTPIQSGTTNDFRGICFTDANNGWVVGSSGTILRTTNGGINWIEQSTPNPYMPLWSVCFIDANNGFVAGSYCENYLCYSLILGTTNGGNDWSILVDTIDTALLGIFFSDADNGTVVGGDFYGGVILRTTDAGVNWIEQTIGSVTWLGGIFFTNALIGWAVDYNGTILHTTNGGVPVELTSFTVATNGKEVILNWTTATELNNQGFEIQRSTDGKEFFIVGFVNGHGTTTEQQNYTYADKNLDNGNYYYRLKQIDFDGSYEYSDVVEIDFRTFNSYLLEQCYPNPFNPTTTIGFGIQNKSNVKITILNAIGEEVAVVLNEEKEAGFHQVEFNASSLPSGVYFYQLKAGSFIETKKMLLLK